MSKNNKESKEKIEINIPDEKLQEFMRDYFEAVNHLRNKDLTEEVMVEYENLPVPFIRQLVGDNLVEAAIALNKVQPETAAVLFNIGEAYLRNNIKELEIQYEMGVMMDNDPEIKKLFDELVTGEVSKNDKSATDESEGSAD